MIPTIVLVGPPRSAGGGVLAFCDSLERGLSRLGVPTDRLWIGAGRGDDNDIAGSMMGVKALIRALPSIWAKSGVGKVVHLNTSFTQKAVLRDAVLYAIARLHRSKVLTEFHGGSPSQITDPVSKAAMRLLCNSNAVVVINQRQLQQFRDLYPSLGNRLHLIFNAVELPDVDLDSAIQHRLRHPRVAYVSRLVAEKGLLETVHAVGILRQRGVNVALDVCGGGPARSEVEKAVREERIEDLVLFHGHVPVADTGALLREASILSLPSYYKSEGQPMCIIEAFAWGLPVIGSNVEPVSFMVQEGVHGASVPPRNAEAVADAIQRLLSDHKAYDLIARNNRALAEESYNLERSSKRFQDLYLGSI